MRDIQDVLNFRNDISPFLVHLSRERANVSARDRLTAMIQERTLRAGSRKISDARFGGNTMQMTPEQEARFFSAVCFTETPINEIHCLLEIEGRKVDLEPYGLVFLKQKIEDLGVEPVFYVNNINGDKDPLVRGLFALINTNEDVAAAVLPLISVFGRPFVAPGANPPANPPMLDFRWEREWRFAAAKGEFHFTEEDVFVGLCPHDEIEHFENLFPPIGFIDPTRNMKWYATKLIEARQRTDLKFSVV